MLACLVVQQCIFLKDNDSPGAIIFVSVMVNKLFQLGSKTSVTDQLLSDMASCWVYWTASIQD